jgi:hypothetical protein
LLGPAFLILNGLSLGLRVHPLFLLSVPLGVVGLVPALRARTVLEPSGITVCNGVRTRTLPWAEVAGLRTYGQGGAVTRDGRTVLLPGVVVRPPAPAAYAHPRSVQAVRDYAAAHGADVELRAAPDA